MALPFESSQCTLEEMADRSQLPVTFEGVTPIFRVRDVNASVRYYADVLAFKVDWQSPAAVASVSRDRCRIFLVEGDQGNPGAWVWVGVTDAGALFDEYRINGAKIRQPPTNFQWAFEMQIEDLDGNILRFGSDSLANKPYGPWMDMRGELWAHLPDGSVRRVQ
jgi:catechol 2,3-dioxygenase-like lactoylglutathione lyase family enzyme